MEKQNTPTLRFPEFQGDWQKKKLGELGKILGGGTPTSNSSEFWDGDIPWVSSSDILEDNILHINISRFISAEAIKKSATKLIPKNSILIVSRVGIGKFAVAKNDICTSQDFSNFILKNGEPYFSAYYFSSKKKRFLKLAQGTSIKGFTGDDIRNLSFHFPTLPEQQKIASFLTEVDNKLQALKRKKELLEQYKKGMMQKLFSQQLRFKDENGNPYPIWEKKKLGDITEIIGGGTPSTSNKEYWDGEIQWFTPSEIKEDYVKNSLRTITELGVKRSSAKILPEGTILLTTRATIGEVAINKAKCTTNQGFQSLVVKNKTNTLFLFNWIKQSKKEFLRRANGSTFLEISKKEIEGISLDLPSYIEQTKIANFLTAIDQKIEQVGQQIVKAEIWKKGLLQKMFV